MDNKFYVSLEAARLLKEKGYDGECEQIIKEDGEILYGYNVNHKLPVISFSCPTKSEAIDWIESKGIVIELRYDNDDLHKDDSEWIYYIYQYDNEGRLYETVSSWGMGMFYDSRSEAEDAAIIRALKEITKK